MEKMYIKWLNKSPTCPPEADKWGFKDIKFELWITRYCKGQKDIYNNVTWH